MTWIFQGKNPRQIHCARTGLRNGTRGHYERGLLTKRIFRISHICTCSRFKRIRSMSHLFFHSLVAPESQESLTSPESLHLDLSEKTPFKKTPVSDAETFYPQHQRFTGMGQDSEWHFLCRCTKCQRKPNFAASEPGGGGHINF